MCKNIQDFIFSQIFSFYAYPTILLHDLIHEIVMFYCEKFDATGIIAGTITFPLQITYLVQLATGDSLPFTFWDILQSDGVAGLFAGYSVYCQFKILQIVISFLNERYLAQKESQQLRSISQFIRNRIK